MLQTIVLMQALQLADSELAATRRYWRKELGFSDAIADDPRPMKEILGDWPDWRRVGNPEAGQRYAHD